jgi:hypothetical protein
VFGIGLSRGVCCVSGVVVHSEEDDAIRGTVLCVLFWGRSAVGAWAESYKTSAIKIKGWDDRVASHLCVH